MAGLPREVARWLLSLGIQDGYEKMKWSVYNGTLPAKILSQFYPLKFDVKTIVNGYATSTRENNWRMLGMVLSDLNINIRSEVIEAVINCKRGSVNAFLQEFYECLTRKKISLDHEEQNAVQRSAGFLLKNPPYAQKTAVCLIRDNLFTAEVIRTKDCYELEKKITALLMERRRLRALERMQHPERFRIQQSLDQLCRRQKEERHKNKQKEGPPPESKNVSFRDCAESKMMDGLANAIVLQPHQHVELK